MFEIGWTEMLVIAIVMIVVVGPKDLPRMLRTFGRMTTKARSMAGDFQRQFNEALKEAELDDVKKSVDAIRGLNPANEIRKQLNPFEKAAADIRSGFDSAMKPTPAEIAEAAAADAAARPAEPLKAGATAMPGVAGPEAMPTSPPAFPAAETRSTPAPAAAAPTAAETAKPKAAAEAKPASKAKAAAKTAAPKTSAAKAAGGPQTGPAKAAPKKTTKAGKSS
ncbi:Sec-independent protein translocase protein TatB [Mesorhizobium sp. CC13]|uniref:Sec-independent protein translocase protein TatB n=1 Tax=Mesorhizobium sp. CC13 TaxID=3029194 RepID=UPI0032640C06